MEKREKTRQGLLKNEKSICFLKMPHILFLRGNIIANGFRV
jgi:hypothetical protein